MILGCWCWWENERNYDIPFHKNGENGSRVLWSRAPWPMAQKGLCESTKFPNTESIKYKRSDLAHMEQAIMDILTRINPLTEKYVSAFSGWGIVSAKPREKKNLRIWFHIDDWDWWRLILLSLEIMYNSQNMMIVFVLHGNNYTSNTIKIQWLSHHNDFRLISAW